MTGETEDTRPSIRVVDLGPAGIGTMTVAAYEEIMRVGRIFVRSGSHPCIGELMERDVEVVVLESISHDPPNTEIAFENICDMLAKKAINDAAVVLYGLQESLFSANSTIRMLVNKCAEKDLRIEFLDSLGLQGPSFHFAKAIRADGLLLLDSSALSKENGFLKLEPSVSTIIFQKSSDFEASKAKQHFLKAYPPEHEATLVSFTKAGECLLQYVRIDEFEKVCFCGFEAILIPPIDLSEYSSFKCLVGIISRLRGPGGCPWDRAQTHASLEKHLIEEAFEVVDAINKDMSHDLMEELGDLLLQVVLHAEIASETNRFDIGDVIRSICRKLIRRHPHVFSDISVKTTEEVVENWETIKKVEKSSDSVLDGVSEGLPSLLYSWKIQSKASHAGFDWENSNEVFSKVCEEIEELGNIMPEGPGEETERHSLEDEIGDVLFSVVNLCRHLSIDPEIALRRASYKFSRRFRKVEEKCKGLGRQPQEMSIDELETLWNESKDESV